MVLLTLPIEFSRVNASGTMAESLRSGDLGDELRDKLSQVMVPPLQEVMDFEKSLPAGVRDSAVVQSANFAHCAAMK